MTRCSSSQMRTGEQTRLVWPQAERSMLIFALWSPHDSACLSFGLQRYTCPGVARISVPFRDLWKQQMPPSHRSPVSGCCSIDSFTKSHLHWESREGGVWCFRSFRTHWPWYRLTRMSFCGANNSANVDVLSRNYWKCWQMPAISQC